MTLLSKKYKRVGQDHSPPEIFDLSFDEHVEIEIENIESELFNIAEAKKREKYLKKRLKALTTCANKLEAKESKSTLDLMSDEAKKNRENYKPMMLDIPNILEKAEKESVVVDIIDTTTNTKVNLKDFA